MCSIERAAKQFREREKVAITALRADMCRITYRPTDHMTITHFINSSHFSQVVRILKSMLKGEVTQRVLFSAGGKGGVKNACQYGNLPVKHQLVYAEVGEVEGNILGVLKNLYQYTNFIQSK